MKRGTQLVVSKRKIGYAIIHIDQVKCPGCGKTVHDQQHVIYETWPTHKTCHSINYWHASCFKYKKRKLFADDRERGINPQIEIARLREELGTMRQKVDDLQRGRVSTERG